MTVSNRLEILAAELADAIHTAPTPPLVAERIVVPHPLLGRWLRLQLAAQLGIAAHLKIELPAEFAWAAMRDVVPDLPATQPFAPRTLRWHLFTALADWQGEDALRRYLADGDPRKRFELADRLATFYDRCLLYRGDWIRAWQGGESPHWQAQLWQAVTSAAPHPAHWIDAVDAYRTTPATGNGDVQLALPLPEEDAGENVSKGGERPRVSFFGVAALSPSYLEMLRAASQRWNVHVYLMSPCREYWADLASRRQQRTDDDAEGNELLAAWGRPAREMQHLLAEELGTGAPAEIYAPPTAQTRLAAVQRDILDLHPATEAANDEELPADDESLQIHACHSPMREAEVLHDRLLGLFDAHDDLEPADVLVLTPSLGDYAPAIEAVFGAANVIPFHIGRQRRRDNTAVQALLQLLALPGSRYGIQAVLAPLLSTAVQRRFGLADADLPPLRTALARAGVRWGINGDHVRAQGFPAASSHTWQHGLQRLLLSYAVAADAPVESGVTLVAGVAPCELSPWEGQADLADYERLGRVADYCEAAFALEGWDEARTAAEWAEALQGLLARFFDTPADRASADASADAVAALIEDFATEAVAAADTPIPFQVMRDVLAARAGEVTRAVPRLADGVTVARLGFGEVLPAQVVCVLGLNARAFPHHVASATFDLIAAAPRRGDRDPRDEDRYAFLDALLAARRCFLVTYIGRDLRDNTVLPPSVVVDELLDYLKARFPNPPPLPCQHPLQAFSPRYFQTSPPLGSDAELFSYSSAMAAAATALTTGPPQTPQRFAGQVGGRTQTHGPNTLAMAELVRFARDAVAYFMRHRLGMAPPAADVEASEDEPLEVAGLDAWALQRDLFALQRAKLPAAVATQALRARGLLPTGNLGAVAYRRQQTQVAELAAALEPYGARLAEQQDVSVDVGVLRLVDRLGGDPQAPQQFFVASADELVGYRLGAIRAQDRIALWLRLLAWTCATGRPATARLLGIEEPRYSGSSPLVEKWLQGPDPTEAATALEDWLATWQEGQRQPLPLFPETSLAWVEGDRRRALQAWRKDFGEGEQPFHRLMFPDGPFTDEFAPLAERLLMPLAKATA